MSEQLEFDSMNLPIKIIGSHPLNEPVGELIFGSLYKHLLRNIGMLWMHLAATEQEKIKFDEVKSFLEIYRLSNNYFFIGTMHEGRVSLNNYGNYAIVDTTFNAALIALNLHVWSNSSLLFEEKLNGQYPELAKNNFNQSLLEVTNNFHALRLYAINHPEHLAIMRLID